MLVSGVDAVTKSPTRATTSPTVPANGALHHVEADAARAAPPLAPSRPSRSALLLAACASARSSSCPVTRPSLCKRSVRSERPERELFGRSGCALLGVGALERGALLARVELDQRIARLHLLAGLDQDLFHVAADLRDDADVLPRQDVAEVLARVAHLRRRHREHLDLARRPAARASFQRGQRSRAARRLEINGQLAARRRRPAADMGGFVEPRTHLGKVPRPDARIIAQRHSMAPSDARPGRTGRRPQRGGSASGGKSIWSA